MGDAVEIDLGGFDAVVAEEFLHLGDAGSACEEIGGETVTEGVGADACARVGGFAGGWPEPKPRPFTACVWVFAFEVVGEVDGGGAAGAVTVVEDADAVEMGAEGEDKANYCLDNQC